MKKNAAVCIRLLLFASMLANANLLMAQYNAQFSDEDFLQKESVVVLESLVDKVRDTIKRTFNVSDGVLLSVSNKFGDVVIVEGRTSTIDVEVNIECSAWTEKKAKRLRKGIDIIMESSENQVDITTDVSNDLFKSSININGSKSYEINYLITVPRDTRFKIRNKFGDVRMENSNVSLDMEVAYGDVVIDNLGGRNNNMELEFCDLKIKNVESLDVDLSYTDTHIDNMVNVHVGEAAFSDIKIDNLTNSFRTDNTEYCDVKIKNVAGTFELIDVLTSFGDVDISLEGGSAVSYELKTSFGEINVDSEHDKKIDKDKNAEYFKAVDGAGEPKGRIFVSTSFGDVKINRKK